jgi:arginyl-tRNA synthetase
MIFDWDEFMTFEWNSFPYVAYSYVRALRVLEKSWISSNDIDKFWVSELFSSPEQVNLYKEIVWLNEILIWISENLAHHNLVLYAYSLAKSFSALYNNVSILWEENFEKKLLNLKLIKKYVETQKLVFEVLAIRLPTKM